MMLNRARELIFGRRPQASPVEPPVPVEPAPVQVEPAPVRVTRRPLEIDFPPLDLPDVPVGSGAVQVMRRRPAAPSQAVQSNSPTFDFPPIDLPPVWRSRFETETEAAHVEAPPAHVEAPPAQVETASVQVEAPPTQVEASPAHVAPRPARVVRWLAAQRRAAQVESASKEVGPAETSGVEVETPSVQVWPEPVQVKPAPVQVEPAPVQVKRRFFSSRRSDQVETTPAQVDTPSIELGPVETSSVEVEDPRVEVEARRGRVAPTFVTMRELLDTDPSGDIERAARVQVMPRVRAAAARVSQAIGSRRGAQLETPSIDLGPIETSSGEAAPVAAETAPAETSAVQADTAPAVAAEPAPVQAETLPLRVRRRFITPSRTVQVDTPSIELGPIEASSREVETPSVERSTIDTPSVEVAPEPAPVGTAPVDAETPPVRAMRGLTLVPRRLVDAEPEPRRQSTILAVTETRRAQLSRRLKKAFGPSEYELPKLKSTILAVEETWQDRFSERVKQAVAALKQAVSRSKAAGARSIQQSRAWGARSIQQSKAVGARSFQQSRAVGARSFQQSKALGARGVGAAGRGISAAGRGVSSGVYSGVWGTRRFGSNYISRPVRSVAHGIQAFQSRSAAIWHKFRALPLRQQIGLALAGGGVVGSVAFTTVHGGKTLLGRDSARTVSAAGPLDHSGATSTSTSTSTSTTSTTQNPAVIRRAAMIQVVGATREVKMVNITSVTQDPNFADSVLVRGTTSTALRIDGGAAQPVKPGTPFRLSAMKTDILKPGTTGNAMMFQGTMGNVTCLVKPAATPAQETVQCDGPLARYTGQQLSLLAKDGQDVIAAKLMSSLMPTTTVARTTPTTLQSPIISVG